jgi:hypothetical protein
MALHAVAITLSSFLLFLVQPIIARRILPWFGGSAGVWTTCMVFFQVALVAGYAYSDVVARRLSLRRQLALHLSLVALSLLFLPIVSAESLKPADASMPVVRGLADALGLEAVRIVDVQPEGGALRTSDWVIASASPEVIRTLRGGGSRAVAVPAGFRAWTDDFHDVFGALKHAPARAAQAPDGSEAAEARRTLAAGQERGRSSGAR